MSGDLTAFIFARGGSKGIKDKNVRIVGGKPLIAHAIECALDSSHIGRVVVSTDSDKITSVALEHGAAVLERPAELAADTTPEILAWRHAIDSMQDVFGAGGQDEFISLPATSPLRIPKDVDAAVERFRKGGCDIVFGISASHRSPYLNMVKIDKNDLIHLTIAGSQAQRRQDVPDVYDITTCVYVGARSYIMSCKRLMDGRVGYVEIPASRAIDVDHEFDLYLANLILTHPFKG